MQKDHLPIGVAYSFKSGALQLPDNPIKTVLDESCLYLTALNTEALKQSGDTHTLTEVKLLPAIHWAGVEVEHYMGNS